LSSKKERVLHQREDVSSKEGKFLPKISPPFNEQKANLANPHINVKTKNDPILGSVCELQISYFSYVACCSETRKRNPNA
jgi:hypothetical protein